MTIESIDLLEHIPTLSQTPPPPISLAEENDNLDMIERLSVALDQVTNQIEEMQREWTNKTRDKIKKLEDQKARIQQLLVTQYQHFYKRMNQDAKTVLLRDKISFVLGVGNACVAPALALRYPTLIPSYYSLQFVFLLILRSVIYRSRRWHYFIFDLCYFVNCMILLFVWIKPESTALFLAAYCLTHGPVAWAIITWRNALVFHSLDKVTSLFIHIFPPLVMYCVKWLPELLKDVYSDNQTYITAFRDQQYPALATLQDPSLKDVLIYSTAAYGIWQGLYYTLIMVKRREKVESGLRLTSYSWLLNGRYGFIQKVVFLFGDKYKLEMFVLLQLVYNIATCIPTYYLYRHFWLSTIFLILMFMISVWNGATYYIEVFSRKYIEQVEKKIKSQ